MTDAEERYELGIEVAELSSSRILEGVVRATQAPVFVQKLAQSDEELAALREPLEKGARALSNAGVPGRPVEWDVSSQPGWIVYDHHGQPLATAVRRGRDSSLVDSVAIETAVALDVLGKLGLAHRAINPRTLFQQNRRIAVLGLDALRASNVPSRVASVSPNDPRFTAPEAFDGGGDIKADVYSLGCVLFALMTGTPPYFGSAQVLREAHQGEPIPTVPGADAVGWNELLSRMLAKDPRARPQPGDIAGLVRKARQRSTALPVAPDAAPRQGRSGRRGLMFGVALGLLLVAGFGAMTVLAPLGAAFPSVVASIPSTGASPPKAAAPQLVAAVPATGAPEATPGVSSSAVAQPTTVPGSTPRAVVTARPTAVRTPAPTPGPVVRVSPAAGPRGTLFRIEAGPFTPGAVFQTSYSTASGVESPSIASGIVGADGIARTTHGTDQRSELGPYGFRIFAGGQLRVVTFQVTN